MENRNVFSFVISILERKDKISSFVPEEGLCLPKDNLLKAKLLKDSLELPRYTCKDRVKCKDFDMDKVKFNNFGYNKAKIVPVNNVSKMEVSYCDMV